MEKKINELKELVESINIKLIEEKLDDELKHTYIQSGDVEIVILEDFESHYFETVVIYEDKAHFFGENFPGVITKAQFIANLKENNL